MRPDIGTSSIDSVMLFAGLPVDPNEFHDPFVTPAYPPPVGVHREE